MKTPSPRTVSSSLLVLALLMFGLASSCGDPGGESNNDIPATCGNGEQDEGEACEPGETFGATCESLGLPAGELGCRTDCSEFDRSLCGAPDTCGNDSLDDGEVCDADAFGGETCQSRGFDTGSLNCSDNCLEIDDSDCSDYTNCEPTTCEDLGETCGTFDDGCGGTLDCGRCPVCEMGCPDGYECTTGDVCTGGEPTGLDLDMRSVDVAGSLLLNGQTPSIASDCYDSGGDNHVWSVEFIEVDHGYRFSLGGNCSSDFTFSGAIYPGTYKVLAGGNTTYTNLLGSNQVIIDELDLTDAGRTDLELNMRSVDVAGSLLVNGQTPSIASDCYDSGGDNHVWSVKFIEVDHGYRFSLGGNCSSDFTFSGEVYPGTYRVLAGGNTSYTNLLGSGQVIIDELDLTNAGRTDLELNMRSVDVAGSLLLNGQTPSIASDCYDSGGDNHVWSVKFIEVDHGYRFSLGGNCSSDFTFSGAIYPGTYKVLAGGNTTYTNLLGSNQVIIDELDLTNAGRTDLELNMRSVDVAGSLRLNGQTPSIASDCYDSGGDNHVWSVKFIEVDHGYRFSLGGNCSSDFTFSGAIYPGTYKVLAGGNTTYTNLLGSNQVIIDELDLTNAGRTDLELNMRSVDVAGTLRLNGQTPSIASDCYDSGGDNHVWSVKFIEVDHGYRFSLGGNCSSDFTFSGEVYPGTYKVLAGGNTSYTNLPGSGQIILENLDLTDAGRTDLELDMRTVDVAGSLLLNGQTPSIASDCYDSGGDNHVWSVKFIEVDHGYRFSLGGNCSSDFTFSGAIYPGTYKVLAGGNTSYTNLPGSGQVIYERLLID